MNTDCVKITKCFVKISIICICMTPCKYSSYIFDIASQKQTNKSKKIDNEMCTHIAQVFILQAKQQGKRNEREQNKKQYTHIKWQLIKPAKKISCTAFNLTII